MKQPIGNAQFSDGRVFIDIAYGCGNQCVYCYCKGAKEPQIVYSENTIMELIQYILADNRFVQGRRGTLVSFCPHTEPFKSSESTKALISLINIILPLGNRIQISTKERVPVEFIDAMKSAKNHQVVIFISISSLADSRLLEPYATDVLDRIDNINRLYNTNIDTCLYIKPFRLRNNEFKTVLALINDKKPSSVCVGIEYTYGNIDGYKHPTDNSLLSVGIDEKMREFRTLYDLEIPIFYTSSCVVAYLNQDYNSINIPRSLCVRCTLECEEQGKWQS